MLVESIRCAAAQADLRRSTRAPTPLRELAAENGPCSRAELLARGVHHFIAAVDALAALEFMTAYTPYQAEISQGTLQMIFEFQTLLCQLTGMEVANASLYDGASAVAEAALMAARTTRRTRICVSAGLHPHWREVLRTYTEGVGLELDTLPLDSAGRTDTTRLPTSVAVIVQVAEPTAAIEDSRRAAEAAHAVGALAIAATAEALSLALLRSPGELGCDIACGDAQSFGLPLSFGGPYAGFLAAREKFVRQLPGRLIGESVDSSGQRAFVMTLATRDSTSGARRRPATSARTRVCARCASRSGSRCSAAPESGGSPRSTSRSRRTRGEPASAPVSRCPSRQRCSTSSWSRCRVSRASSSDSRHRASRRACRSRASRLARSDHLLVCATEMNTRAEIDALVRGLAA
jgi:glycine dehydrogenase subunit 1